MTETSERQAKRRRNLQRPLFALTIPQQRVLSALARYRYLTVAQMIAAGVAKDASHIRADVLPGLCQRQVYNPVEAHDLPRSLVKGRLPRIYTLTKYGAELVAEVERRDPSEIIYPIGGVQFANDYEHRTAYIDACIAFDAWIAADDRRECLEVRYYFDKSGTNRGAGSARLRAATRVDLPTGRFVIPDGLVFFDTGTKQRAVALEIHNFPDVGRIAKQLAGYMDHHVMDASAHAFGLKTAGRVLSLSTDSGLAVRIMDRLINTPGFRESRAFPLMAFNCLESIKGDFGSGWVLADRSPAGIFK